MRTRFQCVNLPLLLPLLPLALATTTTSAMTASSMSSTASSSSAMASSTSAPMGSTAQNATYLSGLLAVLNTLNLGALVNATQQVNQSDTGSELLAALSENAQNRQLTLFAPTNEAFAGVASNISSSTSLLADTLAYHVVYGNFTNMTQSYPNTTVGRTMLNDMSLVMLEGGKSQVVAWSRMSDGNITVLNQNTPVTVIQQSSYENLHINVVDAVIDIPGSLQAALASNNLSSLNTVLSNVQSSNGQGSLLSVLNDNTKGFTLFAPTDAALAAAQGQLSSLMNDQQSLMNLLGNHIINGTSAYGSSLMAANHTSASGESLDFVANSTGSYVFSSNTSVAAMVTKPDVILRNGVMHIIDAVLLDTNSDQGAASSAYASATSVAAQSTTETGPVGSTQTSSSSGSGGSGSGSGSGSGNGSGSSSGAAGTTAGLGGVLGAVVVGAVGTLAGIL
ncbi:FAS1 domain-containing protein [Gloeophyllum trabeum ATCC 11539]|uniref:FAS1 domain-containing protein n=1 Tax=Gloeophyllum trabeum (strain ATCC 11539 / FP-39264 / Madison 617) TaxID=670483 RepID=S7QP40_GLOTA|nr:FAS1 domain-containing protein [Gloeophyllum trabeum ATCC 11539]EPQ61336.1 FAS1 domain-containing protein [Gloeophyllum trabeum ATCC 11539]